MPRYAFWCVFRDGSWLSVSFESLLKPVYRNTELPSMNMETEYLEVSHFNWVLFRQHHSRDRGEQQVQPQDRRKKQQWRWSNDWKETPKDAVHQIRLRCEVTMSRVVHKRLGHRYSQPCWPWELYHWLRLYEEYLCVNVLMYWST